MTTTGAPHLVPPASECALRAHIEARQLDRLRTLLAAVHGPNRFYTRKLDAAGVASTIPRHTGMT